jgi:hypothetical protein
MWYSADQLYSGAWEPQSSCKVLIKPNIFIKYSISPKVLRPGPVQGSGSGFWPGLRVWPGRPGQFFKKKNQNDVVLVKKNKSQRVCHRVLTGSAGSHRVFPSPVFSSTRPGSSPGSAGSRVDPPGRARFQNYEQYSK